jgi:hypothetical protein
MCIRDSKKGKPLPGLKVANSMGWAGGCIGVTDAKGIAEITLYKGVYGVFYIENQKIDFRPKMNVFDYMVVFEKGAGDHLAK